MWNDLDRIFNALANPCRRRILVSLARSDPWTEIEVTDLIEDHDELTNPQVRLHHHHLPKLHDEDFIEWHSDSGTVTRGARFDEIAPVIEVLGDISDELPEDWP